jgi:hypothetical protein
VIYSASRRKAEWDRLHIIVLNKIRAACRESADGLARSDAFIRATPECLFFRMPPEGAMSWESVTITGMEKLAAWGWHPNAPISALVKLAECADD